MSGICGWLGAFNLNLPPEQILAEMSESFHKNEKLQVNSTVSTNAALSLQAPKESRHFYADERFSIAITGKPHWNSTINSEVAVIKGEAQAILDAYKNNSKSFLNQLHGAFSLAIIDKQKHTALLAIDRMGRQPMSYTFADNGNLVFASTTSALNAHPSINHRLNEQSIFNYIYFYMVPSPNTIFEGQRKLQPGEYLYYENGKETVGFYWQPQFSESTTTPLSRLQEEFRALLTAAIQRNTEEDHIGAFLSGGLDSSTVSGMLAQTSKKPANTFSIGFDAKGYDEIEYARITAKHFNTQQHEYYVTPADVVTAIPLIAQGYDEPYGNSSAVPTYFCALLAKENGVNTLLAGDGGDELFAGNTRYAKQRTFEFYSKFPLALRKGFLEPLLLPIPANGRANPIRKLQSYIKQAKIPLPERLESYNLLHMVPLTEMFPEEFLNHIDTENPVSHLRDVYTRAHTNSTLNRMLYLDWKITLADNDLRKVNNMCTLAGIDVRYPMLDDDLVEFSTRIPSKLKLQGSKLRYFFKQSLRDFLPVEIINKPKHGFGLPFGVWLKESPELQALANDSIVDFKKRGYMRPEYLDQLVDQHRSEHAAFYGEMLWPLMMLELWLKAHGH